MFSRRALRSVRPLLSLSPLCPSAPQSSSLTLAAASCSPALSRQFSWASNMFSDYRRMLGFPDSPPASSEPKRDPDSAEVQANHYYQPQWEDNRPVPITFVHWDGTRFDVQAPVGETLLDVAHRNGVPILGRCQGGDNSEMDYGEGPICRTCHVYVDTQNLKKLPEKGWGEKKETYWMDNVTGNSRFACEIIVKPELAGMVVLIPYLRDIMREGRDPNTPTPI